MSGWSPQTRWLGRVSFGVATEQCAQIHPTLVRDTVIGFEPEAEVVALGRRAPAPSGAVPGCDVMRVDRGGLATAHGPGQLVVYPLLEVPRLGLGVKRLPRWLCECMAAVLSPLGLQSHYRDDAPGLWVGEYKLAAVGLRVRQRRTMHGLALNVTRVPSGFAHIVPCGLRQVRIASVADFVSGPTPSVADLWWHFCNELTLSAPWKG